MSHYYYAMLTPNNAHTIPQEWDKETGTEIIPVDNVYKISHANHFV